MSYIFQNSPLCIELIHIINTYKRKPDHLQCNPTSHIIKPVLTLRKELSTTKLTMDKILYSMYFSNLPSAWLLNKYDEKEWEYHVKSNSNQYFNFIY